MKPYLFTFALLVFAGASVSVAPLARGQAAPNGDVVVTATYRGTGAVDAKHNILVFLFSSAKIDSSTPPIAKATVDKNGDKALFKSVATKPVYVAAIYNQNGDYDGTAGPPPDGTPTGFYRRGPNAELTPVEPGPKASISLTFDDSTPWRKQ